MRTTLLFIALTVLSSIGFSQETIQVGKEFNISSIPNEAVIYVYSGPWKSEKQLEIEALENDLSSMSYFKKLGSGSYPIEIDDYDDLLTLVAVKQGYLPVVKTFAYNKELKKEMLSLKMELTTRIFNLDASPYDADIFVDGEKMAHPYPFVMHLGENTNKTVEVKKEGYLTKTEVFYNQEGKTEAPLKRKTITLDTRVVHFETTPAEGSYIYVDGVKVGEGNAQIVLKPGTCVLVKADKEGFVEIERTYCNKEGSPEPPVSDKVSLSDRKITIRVPDGATIRVNGKEVGTSEYTIKLVKGSKAKIEVEKKGFVTYMTTIHNDESEVAPPAVIVLSENTPEFPEDESFSSSTESDVANRDFVMSTPDGMSEENAWKIVAQIIQTYFDELEQIDRETGYLRTAWVYKRYPNRTVRTRVIVKINNREPLKYSLKISSEECSDRAKLDSRDDDDFRPWDRVLNKYKEIISEMQARLK